MCTAAAPSSAGDALRMLHAGLAITRSAAGFLAAKGAADLPVEAMAEGLLALAGAAAVHMAGVSPPGQGGWFLVPTLAAGSDISTCPEAYSNYFS